MKCSGKMCVGVRRIACRAERGNMEGKTWKGVQVGENEGGELATKKKGAENCPHS